MLLCVNVKLLNAIQILRNKFQFSMIIVFLMKIIFFKIKIIVLLNLVKII